MKRGQAEVFNWVFVIVIGVVIFIFFVGFGVKYKGLMEDRNDVRMLRSIDVMLEGLKNDDLYDEAKGIKFDFKLGPNKLILNNFEKQFGDKFIFGDRINGNILKAWVKDFKFPYKTASFIFLSDERTVYYLIGDNTKTSEIRALMPKKDGQDRFNVIEMSSFSETFVSSGQKARFVFFGSFSGIERARELGEVVKITDTNIIYDDESFEIFDELLKVGAVFSNEENFKANYNNLKDKVDNLSKLYKKRMTMLYGNCPRSPTYLNDIYEKQEELILQNNGLRNNGCDVIF